MQILCVANATAFWIILVPDTPHLLEKSTSDYSGNSQCQPVPKVWSLANRVDLTTSSFFLFWNKENLLTSWQNYSLFSPQWTKTTSIILYTHHHIILHFLKNKQTIKAIYEKPIDNIIPNNVKLKPSPLRSGTTQNTHSHHFYLKMVLEFLDRTIRQEKERKRIQGGR